MNHRMRARNLQRLAAPALHLRLCLDQIRIESVSAAQETHRRSTTLKNCARGASVFAAGKCEYWDHVSADRKIITKSPGCGVFNLCLETAPATNGVLLLIPQLRRWASLVQQRFVCVYVNAGTKDLRVAIISRTYTQRKSRLP